VDLPLPDTPTPDALIRKFASDDIRRAGELPPVRDGIDMAKLVGRPHVFGRFKTLPNGMMVEPVANLVLQPDGRVTGHGHPNEGWMSVSASHRETA